MREFFDLEGPFFRTVTKMLDIIWLSAIFLVSCLPVITIGASLSALYYTVHKNIMDSRSYPSKEFFRSFASCFKQSTLGFLIVGSLSGLISWECYMMYQYALAGDKAGRMGIPLLIVLAIVVMWATQLFPYISRFENNFKSVLKNSFYFVFSYPHYSLVLLMGLFVAVRLTMKWIFLILFMPALYMVLCDFFIEKIYAKFSEKE
ncbi:MAG: YesL family protein [Pseudobutyrivibrio sp.]|nr:YesL family protein [Pseudobutyrivibrio sp.]